MVLVACAPSRLVRPLAAKQKAIGANLGGPLIGFAGTTIPIPLTSLYYAQGINPSLSAFGSLHTTSLLFGVIQTDIGVCKQLYYHDSLRLGISVNPAMNMAFDKWEKKFRAWPQVDLNIYWDLLPKKVFVYGGATNWLEFAQKKAFDRPQQTHVLICPQVGGTWIRPKWNYTLEAKWIAPNIPNTPNVVEYRGINHHGAVGIYFTLIRKF